ncbi:Phosphorylated CTD-interacting factor-like protein [Dinothrombium tinctorium]|uniref:Phosphorylated CTD-interacting factor-like protein n=1 Tax=Dinothrombium tinctorium TaxID=1965070 RepID=A0A3S4R3X0_9ACAR|nr:Phosphorylated CTD-interacting factor-like protein [Dinothrombium tinctorium]RWS10797.1 Phosphorylated CTD-interacting factor-like protein [Dinothrombium tinctorium]RWS11254.1 Phosphorylated CTD-interacting factor-like protein [Dinothrombium tinctorium]
MIPIFLLYRYFVSRELDPKTRSVELCDLDPKTEYQVELSVIAGNKTYKNPIIGFISPSDEMHVYGRRGMRGMTHGYAARGGPVVYRLDEIAIVVFVLCFWMAVIFLFCNKWGKIRHLEPYQPQYQPETPFQSPVYSIHNSKPTRMNTCTSSNYPPFFATMNASRINMHSFERQRTMSAGSKIGSLYHCASACIYQTPLPNRPRVNSVIVNMSPSFIQNGHDCPLKRKFKSAEDIEMYSFKQRLDNQKRLSHTNLMQFHPYFRH